MKTWQAERINTRLRPTLGYLGKLLRRMEQRDFPPDDKLYLLVKDAHDALFALNTETHYLSCSGGVGRKQKE